MTHYRYLVFAPLIFFVGVALAFVTPLGGIGMALGIVSLYSSIHPQMENSWLWFGPSHPTFYWGAAFYIGILAAIVTLGSFVFPIGPGYSEMYRPWPQARGNLKERLFVWGRGNTDRRSMFNLSRGFAGRPGRTWAILTFIGISMMAVSVITLVMFGTPNFPSIATGGIGSLITCYSFFSWLNARKSRTADGS